MGAHQQCPSVQIISVPARLEKHLLISHITDIFSCYFDHLRQLLNSIVDLKCHCAAIISILYAICHQTFYFVKILRKLFNAFDTTTLPQFA